MSTTAERSYTCRHQIPRVAPVTTELRSFVAGCNELRRKSLWTTLAGLALTVFTDTCTRGRIPSQEHLSDKVQSRILGKNNFEPPLVCTIVSPLESGEDSNFAPLFEDHFQQSQNRSLAKKNEDCSTYKYET